MIFVGIDDTDVEGSRGTNQLARAIVRSLSDIASCLRIIRHQLLDDPRVPCTTKNGSASIVLEPRGATGVTDIAAAVRQQMLDDFVEGSDPGLCVTDMVPDAVIDFARRSQREFVSQSDARWLAAEYDILLEGLGGTEDGVIGALAGVGLAATHDDGRIVQLGDWPDDVNGVHTVAFLAKRGLQVCERETGREITAGQIDVGKRLRPNRSDGKDVLFVQKPSYYTGDGAFVALKLP